MLGQSFSSKSAQMMLRSGSFALRRSVPASGAVFPQQHQPQRTAVSLSDLRQRIKATANVAKLTNVMKLVASSKLKNAEKNLEGGRPFGQSLMDSVAMDNETMEELVLGKEEGTKERKQQMILVFTTDRGLCGSVNSTIARMLPEYLEKQRAKGFEPSLFVLGEKGVAQIARMHPEIMRRAIDSAFDKDPIFPLAAALGEKVVAQDFDVLTFVFNQYENAAKFNTVFRHVPQLAGLGVGIMPEKFKGYEVEPENNEEALVNMMEFSVAGSIFYAMLETTACEVSQRVTAMDNASSNAADMVDKYTLLFNRARQSKITTELTEIISGAESIADGEE